MKKSFHQGNKSLKTVYIYLSVVLFIICISLAIKVLYIYQQSKYDSSHEFVLAIIQNNYVKEIAAFHPETQAISVLKLQDQNLLYNSFARNYGIASDGYIETQKPVDANNDIASFIWASIIHTTTWRSNLTVLDKIRLILFAKNISINNISVEQISLTDESPDLNTIIATTLNDQNIASENVTIQIINATDVSGLGQRLGKVLTNMGADVVDVSSSPKIQKKSTITYFGNDSYTVDRLQKFLGLTANTLTKQTIADIIITIGTDKENSGEF